MNRFQVLLATILAFAAGTATAQVSTDFPPVTLFKNVMVFDGVAEKLKDVDVLVVGNRIQTVAKNIPETGSHEFDQCCPGFFPEPTKR